MKQKFLVYLIILANVVNCKQSAEISLLESAFLLFVRKDRVAVSGSAVKGIIKRAEVNIHKVNQDGTCDLNSVLGQATTDENGNYSVLYNKTNSVICVRVKASADGFTKMYDEKTRTDISIPPNSDFNLTNIFPEDKLVNSARGNNSVSPFSRMVSRRFANLMASSSGRGSASSLNQRASKEVVIRFGLSSGLSSSNSNSRNLSEIKNTSQTSISASNYPELLDLNIDFTNLNNPLSVKHISILAGFSYLANKHKKGTIVDSSDVDSVIDSFAKDFEDGIFDGKDSSGKQLSLGFVPNQIPLPANSISNILLPAMVAYFAEGGNLNIGQSSTTRPIGTGSTPTTIPASALNQISFLDSVPLIFGISYPQQTYVFNRNISITNLVPVIEDGVIRCEASPALPSGLSISNTCVISGTPTTTSPTTNYSIIGTKQNGNLISTSITISVEINNTILTNYYANQVFSFFKNNLITNIVPQNLTTVVSCTTNPSLPLGLSISNTCVISGTPTVVSPNTSYAITATKQDGNLISTNITIKVEILNSLYVLNGNDNNLRIYNTGDNGVLTLANTVATVTTTPSGVIYNGKHVVVISNTMIKSFLRNNDGSLTFVNSLTVTDTRCNTGCFFHPNNSSFYAYDFNGGGGFSRVGRFSIDNLGILTSNSFHGGSPANWLVLGGIHPSGTSFIYFNLTGNYQRFLAVNSITGVMTTDTVSTNQITTVYITDNGGCEFSNNGNFLYCNTLNSSNVINQFSVSIGSPSLTILAAAITSASEGGLPATDTVRAIKLSPDNNYLYAYGRLNLWSFNVNTSTGIINPTAINSRVAPNSCPSEQNKTDLAIHSNGNTLYSICASTGNLGTYPLTNGNIGAPTVISTASGGTLANRLLFVSGN